jgi:glycosyltransferase involved in cell wall biosynthesis
LITGICINGRFMSERPAATYAVARHLSEAFAKRLSVDGTARRVGLIVPPNTTSEDTGFAIEEVGHMTSNLWEQLSLPGATRGRLLLNFAARSPLFVRNALTMVHDAQVFTAPTSYSRAFRVTLKANIRLAGRLQRGLLTVSEFSKSELVGLGIVPAARIHVIHNGVDHILLVTPEDGVLDRLGVLSRGFALGLANTQPHKNIGVLLRAFARPEMANLKLVLAGKAKAADFTALGIPMPPNVIFAGYVSDGEMRSLQAHALAVCTPSLTEGFGMPPIEGMLLGTPAVISPCGALPEVCGPDTLQADPHDPIAWSHTLLRLKAEPDLWNNLSDTGRAFAVRFTWDAAATRLEEILADILK